jgi:hypothetical protein
MKVTPFLLKNRLHWCLFSFVLFKLIVQKECFNTKVVINFDLGRQYR